MVVVAECTHSLMIQCSFEREEKLKSREFPFREEKLKSRDFSFVDRITELIKIAHGFFSSASGMLPSAVPPFVALSCSPVVLPPFMTSWKFCWDREADTLDLAAPKADPTRSETDVKAWE